MSFRKNSTKRFTQHVLILAFIAEIRDLLTKFFANPGKALF